jgi:alpha-glucosidase
VLVGEVYFEPHRLVRYYGREGRGAHLPFNFALVTLPWRADVIARAIATYEGVLPGTAWPNWVLGNHDQPRIASRVGPAQARVAAMLLLTLRGTPTLYYGDELGLPDAVVPPARVVDVDGRDPERSPMPWSASLPNAGFSDAEPWLPMAAGAAGLSVEAQRADPGSTLQLHRRLLALRRSSAALQVGAWTPRHDAGGAANGLLAYDRTHRDERLRVLLNLTHEPIVAVLPGRWVVAVGTDVGREGLVLEEAATLAADEGLVLRPA